MPAPSVAAQGRQQKNSEWENLLGAAHLELRAQQTDLVLGADAADAANARVASPSETSCGAGNDRHEATAAASSPGLRPAKHGTRGGGGGIVSTRGTARRDGAASLPADQTKKNLSQRSMAVPATCGTTGANTLPETATAKDSTASPSSVVNPAVDSSRRMAACPPRMAGSTRAAVSSATSPPPAPTAFGMVAAAAAASDHIVEERNRNVRVQAKDASEGPVRPAHTRAKGMGRRGPLGQSHFKGVSITRAGTWRAVIYKGRKQQYLGVFDSEFDAARAYDAAALRLFPEGAPLNNPDAVERQLNEISSADGKPIATAGTPSFPHEQEPSQAWEA